MHCSVCSTLVRTIFFTTLHFIRIILYFQFSDIKNICKESLCGYFEAMEINNENTWRECRLRICCSPHDNGVSQIKLGKRVNHAKQVGSNRIDVIFLLWKWRESVKIFEYVDCWAQTQYDGIWVTVNFSLNLITLI